MKRWIALLLCATLLLPVGVLPAFAEEGGACVYSNPGFAATGEDAIDFTYAVQDCFDSLGWLSDTMDTRFVAWMKKHKIINMKTEDLKKAHFDSRSEQVQERLLRILQEKNEETGNPKDKIYFYKKTDAQLINDGC